MTTHAFYSVLSRAIAHAQSLDAADSAAVRYNWTPEHRAHVKAQCEDRLDWLADMLPSGSGIDNGCKLDLDASRADRIVINFGFHHMDQNGFYDGWSDFAAVITPSLAYGYVLTIKGKNRDGIKDYLHDLFAHVITQQIAEYPTPFVPYAAVTA